MIKHDKKRQAGGGNERAVDYVPRAAHPALERLRGEGENANNVVNGNLQERQDEVVVHVGPTATEEDIGL